MGSNANPRRLWLIAAVLSHLVVSLVHGAAPNGAHVPLPPAANLFVFVVILAGPLVGLAWTWRSGRIGSWIIAIAMAGSLVFGVVNHFVVASPDHVSQVEPQWRPVFATTAVLLAVIETLGLGLAISAARERANVS
jgi:MFS family permease